MISKTTIDKVFSSIDGQIYEIIKDFVDLKKKGKDYLGCCPFHNEKTPSFYVSPTKNIYKCFGCQQGGTAVSFLMDKENMSYPDALTYLAKKFGVNVEYDKDISEEQKKEYTRIMSAADIARDINNEFVKNFTKTSTAFKYMKGRGYEEETLKYFNVGFHPKDLKFNGTYDNDLVKDILGLVKTLDEKSSKDYYSLKYRATIPYVDEHGKILGWTARTLYNAKEIAKIKADHNVDVAKWKNSQDSDLFNKSKNIFNLFMAKRSMRIADNVYVVEGAGDVMSVFQAGIENIVACNGTAMTQDQAKKLAKYCKCITLMYDGDSAGLSATLKNGKLILENNCKVRVKRLPHGKDPGDYFVEVSKEAAKKRFNEIKEIDYIDFLMEVFVNEKEHPEKYEISEYLKKLSSVLNYDVYKYTRKQYITDICSLFSVTKETFNEIYRYTIDEIAEEKVKSQEYGKTEANSKDYLLVGDTYYQNIVDFNPHTYSYEMSLEPRKVGTIEKHFIGNKKKIMRIPMFDAFCNIPDNTEVYKQTKIAVQGGVKSHLYNLYHPVIHRPKEGEWKTIDSFLQHIFQSKNIEGDTLYEFAMDYLQLTYLKPAQRLPVLCLVSRERNTGKSTFLDFMRLLFGDNVAMTDNERFTGKFTSHFITKLIVTLDEGFIPMEQKIMKERIKNMSTQKKGWSEAKGGTPQQINVFTHLIMCSNDEKNFMQIDDGENRFAVIKVPSLPRDKENPRILDVMLKEIHAFLYHLKNRKLHYQENQSRFSFPVDVYTTELLKEVQMRTMNPREKEVREVIKEQFILGRVREISLTLMDIHDIIRENNSQLRITRSFIRETINDIGVEQPSNKASRYDFYKISEAIPEGDQDPETIIDKRVGRPYVFRIKNWLSIEEILELSGEEGLDEKKASDDLPF